MAEISLTDLFATLNDWWEDEERLIGIDETQEIEFKLESWNLATDIGKLEFAKDVSAMANGGGGVFVLGIRTGRDPAVGRDISEAIFPLEVGLIDLDQIESIAREWIYPPQRSIEIREWVADDGDRMLVSLRVPPLREEGGLALIRAAELDGQVRRNVFGLASRHGDRVDFFNPDEVFHWVRSGRRITGIGPSIVDTSVGGPSPEDEASAELDSVRDMYVDYGWPVLVLQAWPATPVRLRNIHGHDGLRGALERRDSLRDRGGFNLRWLREFEVYRDGGLSASLGQREGLRVIPGGVLTLYGDGGPDLLGWGMEQHGGLPRVNPTVVSELTYEFVALVMDEAVPSMTPPPEQLVFSVSLLYANRPQPMALQPGYPSMTNLEQSGVAAEDEVSVLEEVELELSNERVTGLILQEFYGRFGLGHEAIPFINDEGDFDPDRFLELVGGFG